MLIKFFAHGKGSGSAPIDYVCHVEGREHAPPEVLRGDVDRTKDLIDSIDREWRYTSGVISFALEDSPTEAQQEVVMSDFEKTAFAGLEPDQYDILWVRHQHTERSRVELHFITPRMELTTGKALNIAPPNWKKHFDPLQNALNYINDWADPHDPKRARITKRATENDLRSKDRETIGKYVESLVEASMVSNRADIVAALQDAGLEINRQGKDYISVKDPQNPNQKAFRLKGAIYAEDWTSEQLSGTSSIEARSRETASRGINNERIELARAELTKGIRKRADYNAERYKRPDESLNAELKSRLEANNLDSGRLHVFDLVFLDNSLVGEQFQNGKDQHLEPTNQIEAKEPGRSERENGRLTDNQIGRGELSGFSEPKKRGRNLEDALQLQRKAVFQDYGKQVENEQDHAARARIIEVGRKLSEWYETGFNRFTKWFDDVRKRRESQRQRTVEISRKSADDYRENLNRSVESINSAFRELSNTNRAIEQATEKVRPIVKEQEKVRERNSNSWGLGM